MPHSFQQVVLLMIEKVTSSATSGLFVNEVIEYTGKSINQLTGLY
jgi:hypothetical protein